MCPECGSDSILAKRRRKKNRQPESTRQLKFSIIMLALITLGIMGWAIVATFSSAKKSFQLTKLQLRVQSLETRLKEAKPRSSTAQNTAANNGVSAFPFQPGQSSGVLMQEEDDKPNVDATAMRPISQEEESVLAAFQDVYRNLTGEEISKKDIRTMALVMGKAAEASQDESGEMDTAEFLENLEKETMAESQEFLKLFEAAKAGMDPESFQRLQELSGGREP